MNTVLDPLFAAPVPSQILRDLERRLVAARLLAVVTIPDPRAAMPLLGALQEGGVTAVELAWRTPGFLPMLESVRRQFPAMLLGVGTVLNPPQARLAREAGADFGLSPGFCRETAETARDLACPFIPGVATAGEIQSALMLGYRLLKLFPAWAFGGPKGVRLLLSPFLHLDPKLVVLGGVGPGDMEHYFGEPGVAVVGGSWIAPPTAIAEALRSGDWSVIVTRAREASLLAGSM